MNDVNTKSPKTDYKKKPHFNIYKPLKKADAGAALQFSYDAGKQAIFLEATKQKGAKLPVGDKAQFDWVNKIVFKLGVVDLGALLMFFNGRSKEVKLLHSNEDRTRITAMELKPGSEFNGKPTFAFKLGRTLKGGDSSYVQMYLSQEELALLAHFARESLTRMFGFGD